MKKKPLNLPFVRHSYIVICMTLDWRVMQRITRKPFEKSKNCLNVLYVVFVLFLVMQVVFVIELKISIFFAVIQFNRR